MTWSSWEEVHEFPLARESLQRGWLRLKCWTSTLADEPQILLAPPRTPDQTNPGSDETRCQRLLWEQEQVFFFAPTLQLPHFQVAQTPRQTVRNITPCCRSAEAELQTQAWARHLNSTTLRQQLPPSQESLGTCFEGIAVCIQGIWTGSWRTSLSDCPPFLAESLFLSAFRVMTNYSSCGLAALNHWWLAAREAPSLPSQHPPFSPNFSSKFNQDDPFS